MISASLKLNAPEKAVARLLRLGLSDQEIGDRTGTSLLQVKHYTRALFRKLSCRNRVELAVLLTAPLDSPHRKAIEERNCQA